MGPTSSQQPSDYPMFPLRVFHDESEPKPWFLIGLLWLSNPDFDSVSELLQRHRKQVGYQGEVHFKDLGRNHLRTRLSDCWFNDFKLDRLPGLKTYVMVVDKRPVVYAPGFFKERFHEYNRFTALALYSSFRWFWGNLRSSTTHFYSDQKQRRPPDVLNPDGVTTDNFESYVRERFETDTSTQAKNPTLDGAGRTGTHEVKLVRTVDSGRPTTAVDVKPLQDLLQLCDLLTGAVAQSFSGASKDHVKKRFGFEATKLIRKIEPASKEPDKRLRRRFQVGVFPDEAGRFRKTHLPLACRTQIKPLEEYGSQVRFAEER